MSCKKCSSGYQSRPDRCFKILGLEITAKETVESDTYAVLTLDNAFDSLSFSLQSNVKGPNMYLSTSVDPLVAQSYNNDCSLS